MNTTHKTKNKIDFPTFGYNHLEVGHPDNLKTYRVCGAITHSENAQADLCQNAAGLRTSHPGVGRCYLHAGNSLAGPDNPAFKHGRYAHIFKERMKQEWEQFNQAGEDVLDLTSELAAFQFLFSLLLGQILAGPDQPAAISQVGAGIETCPTCGQKLDKPKSINNSASSSGVVDGGGMSSSSVMGPLSSGGREVTDQHTENEEGVQRQVDEIASNPKNPRTHYRLIDMEKLQVLSEYGKNISDLAGKIVAMRNSTALGAAEIKYLQTLIVKVVADEFRDDKERGRSFISKLLKELPGGDVREDGGSEGEAAR